MNNKNPIQDIPLDPNPSTSKDQDNNEIDLTNLYQTIPKEIKKIFQGPPSLHSNLTNYGAPIPPIPAQFSPYYPNPYNQIYQSNYGNNHHSNSTWNMNPYHRRNVNPFDHHSSMPTIISKLAEDKMKPTFKSIEMILETFNSISMILDSTYSALYGSFRTITGVADHLIFIRNHFLELALFPRLARLLIDFLRWLFNFIGLNNTKFASILERQNEDIWKEALTGSSSDSIKNILANNERNSSLWPVVIFFSLVLGTPYIVWRLLGSNDLALPRTNLPEWITANGRHFIAIGLYDFKARNSNELSFQKGQRLFIKPDSLQPDSKYVVACTTAKDQQIPNIGFIPLNFVKLLINK